MCMPFDCACSICTMCYTLQQSSIYYRTRRAFCTLVPSFWCVSCAIVFPSVWQYFDGTLHFRSPFNSTVVSWASAHSRVSAQVPGWMESTHSCVSAQARSLQQAPRQLQYAKVGLHPCKFIECSYTKAWSTISSIMHRLYLLTSSWIVALDSQV